MFILTRILCRTIEYYCITIVLYKLINIYIYVLVGVAKKDDYISL